MNKTKNTFNDCNMRTSSGVRFVSKPKMKFCKRVPCTRERFAKNCSNYGLTPDFYMALCVESVDSEESYYLQELDGAHGVLMGDNGISMMTSFDKVVDMLINGLEQESINLDEKINLFVLDKSIPEDNVTIRTIREDIKNKKKIAQHALSIRNCNMKEVFYKMSVQPNVGCKICSYTYEFVSYRPEMEKPYVLECLDKKDCETGKHRFVDFKTLKKAIAAYAEETDDVDEWLKMAENIQPMSEENKSPNYTDDFSQEFFVF